MPGSFAILKMPRSNSRKKIKILFMIDFLYEPVGGTENQLIKIINNLNNKKYDIHLLSLRNTPWIKENRSYLKCNKLTYDIIKLKNPRSIVCFFLILLDFIKIKPDIVMTFFPLSNILGVILARFARVKFVFSTRRDYGMWLERRDLFLLKIANRFVSRIVTNSCCVKDLTSKAEKFDVSKIDVIYNGVELNDRPVYSEDKLSLKRKLRIPTDSQVVGIVAGLKPMKRHSTFLKAAQHVLETRPNVRFVIVGDGPLRKNLEDLTAQLKIGASVHFVGSQEDIIPFISIFDLAVNCSANEGLSNAIMEYMAFDVPCIVSNAGGNSELIENEFNGYTFELDNEEELAERIKILLDDKEKQQEFVENSKRKILDQFTLDKMINNYDKYFSNILAEST